MLFKTLLAASVACTAVIAADTNAARFERGLPPLPPSRLGAGIRKRAYPSATPLPNIDVSAILVQLETADTPGFQFANAINAEYQDYPLTSLASPGMAGTFVFSGYYSSENNRPLYFFRPANAPAARPFMVATFNAAESTVDDLEGVYFTQAAGGDAPYPPTIYSSADTFYVYTEAAIYQIDRTDPEAPVLTFVTLDSDNNEHISSNLCVDGLGGDVELPFLYTDCEDANRATAILTLA